MASSAEPSATSPSLSRSSSSAVPSSSPPRLPSPWPLPASFHPPTGYAWIGGKQHGEDAIFGLTPLVVAVKPAISPSIIDFDF
ncbi:hypothetical protein RHGRI_033515 [Rhododendron griersonianum]|uniref:Uncharacterized protein n=1 Tax=Rhododendron griersonianum TaxID=479676 RepID=A0AAV6HX69_9ERIC|nr:hypothetical protein RHGRI_033515 [Rhododendron griersonianum]